MKAILVLDKMPFDCWYCPLTCEHCDAEYQGRHPKCPLKPMPDKKRMPITKTFRRPEVINYVYGWNECLEEIEK